MENLVIVTPGRSGSEFLLECLNSNPNFVLDSEVFNRSNFDDASFNQFGKSAYPVVDFIFNRARLSKWKSNVGLSFLLKQFLIKYCVTSRVSGFKISLDQWEDFPMINTFLESNSTKIVYLASRDKLRICLSLIKSREINHYHTRGQHDVKKYDFVTNDVLKTYQRLLDQENRFLVAYGGKALKIETSEMFDNLYQTLTQIAEFVCLSKNQDYQISNLKPTNPPELSQWVNNLDGIYAELAYAGINLSA